MGLLKKKKMKPLVFNAWKKPTDAVTVYVSCAEYDGYYTQYILSGYLSQISILSTTVYTPGNIKSKEHPVTYRDVVARNWMLV